ncbi:type II toxin-antitoxin system RelE/ParE family toxin [Planctobacterium marinum]|uniref:type II toxin-antitoxin system RelE/ParE family toxin n=1 Tax=Planctobacterium marinum TaxID=1631968 RepID=UPI001E338EDB|nr:type II toxin-antitoxin system RelE/ParE family toxin [Planctobacterium marinum]MCC2607860.1 type II toxin-antitoxin system RelE/ParE family toxin [Planctobacterium marinum]
MKPFKLTVSAKADLKDIALFTQRKWGKEQRNLYLKQFDESFWMLSENPVLGRRCDEIRDGYRKFPQGGHVIFYQQTDSQEILIIRILHKNMDVNPIRFG